MTILLLERLQLSNTSREVVDMRIGCIRSRTNNKTVYGATCIRLVCILCFFHNTSGAFINSKGTSPQSHEAHKAACGGHGKIFVFLFFRRKKTFVPFVTSWEKITLLKKQFINSFTNPFLPCYAYCISALAQVS